jgi:hypothetical protein
MQSGKHAASVKENNIKKIIFLSGGFKGIQSGQGAKAFQHRDFCVTDLCSQGCCTPIRHREASRA